MTRTPSFWVEKFEKSESEMLPENFSAIKSHIRKMKASKMREQTIVNHYAALIQFGKWCKVPFTSLTEEDMLDYSDLLDKVKYEVKYRDHKPTKVKQYSDGTKYSKLATVKAFLRPLNEEATKAITIKSSSAKKLPEDLLSKEDIEALLDHCPTARDRALVAFMYESGARKGEIFSIKLKNVQFDENGTVVTIPDGKTGARRIRLIFSTSYLREWTELHPCKRDRDHVLFCALRDPYPALSDSGLRNQLTYIAEKAGVKKKVNPHSFRHARATHLAEHLTEQQLKKYLGWTEGSNMAAVYVHLSGKDIDNAILKMNGLKTEETEDENALKTIKCPRCREIQDAKARFCNKCGLPLTQEAVTTVETIKTDYMQLSDLDEILEMKNTLKQELEEISKLKEMMLKAGK